MEGSIRVGRTRTSSAVDWTGVAHQRVVYAPGATIFAQGDPATSVMYVEEGAVRLSVLSQSGKEAVIAVLDCDHFFGEGCLVGHICRTATATAVEQATVLGVETQEMLRRLHDRPLFAEQFLAHMLIRNSRIEADLIDQLFHAGEKRLARTLLLLAGYGEPGKPHRVLPRLSQETLAEMIGTTRSRVNVFMNKFRRLGFIEYDHDTIRIHESLLRVVARD